MIPEIVSENFIVGQKIGAEKGTFKYKGCCKETLAKCIITVDTSKNSQTYGEAKTLQRLDGKAFVPKIFSFGKSEQCYYSVIEDTGTSLEDMKEIMNGRIPLEFVFSIGFHALTELEKMHESGFIHRNLTPENITLNLKNNQIYLRNFKYAKQLLNAPIRASLVDPVYAALSTHLRHDMSKNNDLESLAYVLIYCVRGTLPWIKLGEGVNLHGPQKIYIAKANIHINNLCVDCPDQIKEFMIYTRNREENTNYEYLKSLFATKLELYHIKRHIRSCTTQHKKKKKRKRNSNNDRRNQSFNPEMTLRGNYPKIKDREQFNHFITPYRAILHKMNVIFHV